MAFIKFENRYTPNADKLTLSGSMLNIGKKAFERLGKPERVDIFYDVENKAIRLVANENGRKVYNNKNYFGLSIRLAKLMPTGRYYANKQGDFILEDLDFDK